jgi:cardiolipin synthase
MAEGVHVLIYRPHISGLRQRRGRLRRLHRKLALIDNRIAFIGGINVIDDMDTPGQIPPRYDYAVEVEGPVVAAFCKAVRGLWHRVQWVTLRRRPAPPLPPPESWARVGEVEAALVIRDAIGHRRDIEEAYLEAIAAAKDEIILASAYFLPGRRIRQALADAAGRGVRVVVLLQGKVEYALLHYATQFLYARLLYARINIVEYYKSFLHAKVAVIDRHWATVGSSNIDPFSLLLAREANLVVRDAAFAETLRDSLVRAMEKGARAVAPADLRRRSWRVRLTSYLAYVLVRAAIGLTRYGGPDYRE